MKKELKEIDYGLCSGRHQLPVQGYFFNTIGDPTDVFGLEFKASLELQFLKDNGIGLINLYVTGLTPALIAVINSAKKFNIRIVLYHYDKIQEKYYCQDVY